MNNIIHVLDSIPGTRKTSGAIEYINENPSKPILYICEYKSEIDRVCNLTHCVQPKSAYDENIERYHSKKDDIKQLILSGRSIASSHALFVNFDAEIFTAIEKIGYELILDEVLDPIIKVTSRYNSADYKTLEDSGHIKAAESGKIHWSWDVEKESAYDELREFCETGLLYKAGDLNQFLYLVPIDLFNKASKVTVMTYRFEGSYLYQYLLVNGFQFVPETNIKSLNSAELKKHIKEHIIICHHKGTDKLRTISKGRHKTNGYTFSYNCYLKNIINGKVSNREEFKKFVSSRLNLVFRHIINNYDNALSVSSVMYTLPKEFSGISLVEKEHKGKVFRKRIYNVDRKKTIPAPRISSIKCFVPFNCRGTNEYSDKAILIHCYNHFANPAIKSFYRKYNDLEIDEESLALNTLIQWIFRSRIRNFKKGEKVYVYCLSERMESILKKWIDSL